MKYQVIVCVDTSYTVDVEADDAQQAALRAAFPALIAERDGLLKRLVVYEDQRRRAVDHAEHFVARAERAEAALREAEKDAERLDWLMSRSQRMHTLSGDVIWCVLQTSQVALGDDPGYDFGNNYRAAIDAARQQEKG